MAERVIILDQPQGIGDILFLQKVAKTFADRGFRVIHPVWEKIKWVVDYIEPYPGVEYPILGTAFDFCNEFSKLHNQCIEKPIETIVKCGDKFVFVPLGSAYRVLESGVMVSKYKIVGMGWGDWTDYVKLVRNPEKEENLKKSLEISGSYTLVNEHCSGGKMTLPAIENAVYLKEIEGYTLFDWLSVIEGAEKIITIDTSLVLLCEIFKIQVPLYMVSRYTPPTFEPIEPLLHLPWKLALTVDDLINMLKGETNGR